VEEFDRLLTKAPDAMWKGFMLTAWYSGMRLGELVSLRWDDIDFADHRILVRAEVQGNKAKRDEWIPMHARLEPALRVLDPSTNFVFAFDWTSETVGRRFKELAVAAGLRCTAHDLRRSFCSRLAPKECSRLPSD
jgi:integrase